MKKAMIGTVLLAMTMTSTAMAAPTFGGPTGLINTPTADSVNQGGYSLGFYNVDEDDSLSFNYGIASNVELGVTRFDGDYTTFNGKWTVLPRGNGGPAVAVGIQDAGDKFDSSPYVVASQSLTGSSRLHYGIGGGRFDGVFAGFETDLTFGKLLAEYDGENVNLGARFDVAAGVKVDVGLFDMDEFFVGVSLNK